MAKGKGTGKQKASSDAGIKEQADAAKALQKQLDKLSNTIGALSSNIQALGGGTKDIAQQFASTVISARDLQTATTGAAGIQSNLTELVRQQRSELSVVLKSASDYLGLSSSEVAILEKQLEQHGDINRIKIGGLTVEEKLAKTMSAFSSAERAEVLESLKNRSAEIAKSNSLQKASDAITESQTRRAESLVKLASLQATETFNAKRDEIKTSLQINNLSDDAVRIKIKQNEIAKRIKQLDGDRSDLAKEVVEALKLENAELDEAFNTQLEIDTLLKKQSKELEKHRLIHESIHEIGEKLKGTFGEQGEELAEIGNAFKKSMVSPMALVGALLGSALEEFMKIGKASRDFLNTTGLTVDQTEHLRHQAHELSLEMREQGVRMADVFNAQASLIKQYGTLNQVSDDAIEKVVGLKKAFGVSEEAAAGVVAQLQRSTGASAKTAGNIAALGAQFAKAAGVAPDEVMKDIAGASEDIATYFKGTEKDLLRTAVQARRLGLDIKKIADVSKALLNFESSIEDQMTASVILGREINLDKARQLAMEGKIQEAAEETLKQVGSLADFNKMNAIQKEAIAKAAGMSVGDLQKTLQTQEALKNMTVEQRAEYEKGLKALNAGNEMSAEKLLKEQRNQLTQEKIADAVAKISDIFANVILPVLEPIFDFISGVFNVIGKMAPLIKIIGVGFLLWKGALMASRMYSKLMNTDFTALSKNNFFTKIGKSMKDDLANMKANFKGQGKAITEGLTEGERGSQGFFSRMKDKFKNLFDKKGAAGTVTDKSKALMDKVGEDKYAAYKEARAKGMKPAEAAAAAKEKIADKTKEISSKVKPETVADMKPTAGAVDKTADIAGKGAKSEKAVGGSRAGEGIKTFFTNLAAGLKEMGQGGVAKGVFNSLIAGPAFLMFTLAAPGLFVLQKINGEKIQENLYGLSYGLQDMAKKDVMKGALNLGVSALGFVALTAGAIGFGVIALLGVAAGAGLQGLAAGLKAMANPTVVLGSAVLAGVSLSLGAGMLMLGAGVYFAAKGMAELAAQFKEMEPGQILATAGAFIGFAAAIQILAIAGATATTGVIGLAAITAAVLGLAYAVNIAAPGISKIVGSFKELISNIGGDKLSSVGLGLMKFAGGIGAVSVAAVGALVAVPAMAIVGVAVGTLGTVFSIAGTGFNFAAVGIQTATAALQNLTTSITKDSLIAIADGLVSISKALGAISIAGILAGPVLGALALAGPAISGVGSIFGSDESEPRPAATPTTNTPTTKTTTKEKVTADNTELIESNKAIIAKLDQLINIIANAKGEIKINNSVMGEWIGLGTARNYKAVK